MIEQIIGMVGALCFFCYIGYKRGKNARKEYNKTGRTSNKLVNDLFGN